MKTIILFLGLTLLGAARAATSPEPADIIFTNGNLYTANDRQPQAEALAVNRDRISAVGSNAEVDQYRGPRTRVVDLRGRTAVPGLTDAHYHLSEIGELEIVFNLKDATSLEDLLARVKARAGRTKASDWIFGMAWNETAWRPPVFPTRRDLDRVAPNNPVFLIRADGHGAVANSLALKISGIDKSTPNPFGGEICRDRNGELTGLVLDAAKKLVQQHVPPLTREQREQAVLTGVRRSLERGLCEIHDCSGDDAEVNLYRQLYAEGKIKLRIYKAVHGPSPSATRLLRDGPVLGAFDHRFTARTIKVMFDGGFGSRGAALFAPYADDPGGGTGFLTKKEEDLLPMFEEALRRGIQIATHASGDRTSRAILDLYARAFAAVPADQRAVREPRWRVEHASILTPEDVPRFAQLGVIPSVQPSFVLNLAAMTPRRLGSARLPNCYIWQGLIKAGSILAGGSDAPMENDHPMIGFYSAVARKDLHGFADATWHPEQVVTRAQALKMFTLWAAQAAFEEQIKGSLEPGKLADLTVLSADIMTIPELQILQTQCELTIIGGEVVFARDPGHRP